MNHYLGFWVCTLLMLPLGLRAGDRNVLEEELALQQKLTRDVENLVKQRKIQADGSAFVEHSRTVIAALQERLKLLPCEASSRHFSVYASTQTAADQHLQVAEDVLKDYCNFFPNLNFNPSTPAQLILYPTEADFHKYETRNTGVLGHALSNRQMNTRLTLRGNMYVLEQTPASSQKYHRLATYQQENPYVFVHEVCHILTFEMINPQQMDLSQLNPNRFLNEGLSEFFAARHNPDVFKNRVRVLTGGKMSNGKVSPPAPKPDILQMLSAKIYPEQITAFYSEATLFTKWTMDFPSGPQLFKFLLNANPSQMEALLRTHQRTNGLPDTGFAAYDEYREQTLAGMKPELSNDPVLLPPGTNEGEGVTNRVMEAEPVTD